MLLLDNRGSEAKTESFKMTVSVCYCSLNPNEQWRKPGCLDFVLFIFGELDIIPESILQLLKSSKITALELNP